MPKATLALVTAALLALGAVVAPPATAVEPLRIIQQPSNAVAGPTLSPFGQEAHVLMRLSDPGAAVKWFWDDGGIVKKLDSGGLWRPGDYILSVRPENDKKQFWAVILGADGQHVVSERRVMRVVQPSVTTLPPVPNPAIVTPTASAVLQFMAVGGASGLARPVPTVWAYRGGDSWYLTDYVSLQSFNTPGADTMTTIGTLIANWDLLGWRIEVDWTTCVVGIPEDATDCSVAVTGTRRVPGGSAQVITSG